MSIVSYVSELRQDYARGGIDESNTANSPFDQFGVWFKEAMSSDCKEPNAMTVCTATKSGEPNGRILLLKHFNEDGFVFFTNYESVKGSEFAENPQAVLVFFWEKLERQVRIYGKIEKTSVEESDEYFRSRPIKSRAGAWVSEQSKPLRSRWSIVRKFVAFLTKHPDGDIPLPPFWGGYRLIPDKFEFWQGRQSRLHDRIAYDKDGAKWRKTRLNP